MPTLASLLDPEKNQLVRQGTTLTKKKPSTQQLIAGAGLSSAPITPAGVGMLGGSPDQTKMAGTPNQKQNAMKQALEGESLSTAIRTSQARTEMTAAEQRQKKTQEQLAGLGGLQNRVQGFIQAATEGLSQKAGTVSGQQTLGGNLSNAVGVTDDPNTGVNEASEFERLAKQYASSNFTDAESLAALGNIALRRNPSVNVDTLGEKLKGLIAPETALAGIASQNIADKLTVPDLIRQGALGYTETDLANILGVTPQVLSGMTLQDLQSRVAAEVAAADQYEATQRAVQSGELGAAEAQAARGFMRDISATGLAASEAEMQRLGEQVATGDVVSIGGKEYRVADLLQDQTIQRIITDYLTNPASVDSRALAASNPELVKWIESNKNALAEASSKVEAGVASLVDIQRQNKAIAQTTSGPINEQIMNAIMPGWNDFTAVRKEPPPILRAAQADPGVAQVLVEGNLTPEELKELATMSDEDIRWFGIGKPGSLWEAYRIAGKMVQDVGNINPNDIGAIISRAYGTDLPERVLTQFRDESRKAALGLPNNRAAFDFLDSNQDGRIDSGASLLDRLRGNIKAPSLLEVRRGADPLAQTRALSTPDESVLSPEQQTLYEKLSPALENDGVISAQEMGDIIGKQGLSDAELIEYGRRLADPAASRGLRDDARGVLLNHLENVRVSRTNDAARVEQEQIAQATGTPPQDALIREINSLPGDLYGQGNAPLEQYSNALSSLEAKYTDMLRSGNFLLNGAILERQLAKVRRAMRTLNPMLERRQRRESEVRAQAEVDRLAIQDRSSDRD